jgi:predicted nucleic acid-binding Zn ribbon protein
MSTPDQKSATWKDQLKQRKWGEHKHCVVCGKAIALDKDFCSQPCRDSYQKTEKDKSKKGTWQIVMIFVVMIVMMVVLPMLSGK